MLGRSKTTEIGRPRRGAARAFHMLWFIALGCGGDVRHTVGKLPADFELPGDGSNPRGGAGGSAVPGTGGRMSSGGGGGGALGQDPPAQGTCSAPASLAKRVDAVLVLDTYLTLPFTGALSRMLDGVRAYVVDERAEGSGLSTIVLDSHCDEADYAIPDAPMGVLTAHASRIRASLPSGALPTVTSMVPALRAAVAQARARAEADDSRQQAVVLISQGLNIARASCGFAPNALEAAAREAAQGTPPVPVYVVALWADAQGLVQLPIETLNQTARAGGTDAAIVVDLVSMESMAEALHAVREQATPCEYAVPEGADADKLGMSINFGEIAVPRVSDASTCGIGPTGGFYVAGDRVVACPSTCTSIGLFARHESVALQQPCQR